MLGFLHMSEHTTFKDWALRVISILGLIAILILGAWGIIQIAFVLAGFLGNANESASNTPAVTNTVVKVEQVIVTSPSTITSGVPFTLSFAHENATGNYSYGISYSCAAGLSIAAPLPTGGTQNVPCDTPFNYTNATAQQLTATLTGKTQVNTTFSVAAKNLSTLAITATGTAGATVLPTVSTTIVKPAATTPAVIKTSSNTGSTYIAAKRTTTLYGQPDLAVSTGSITQNNGRYSVQFTVQNVGTNVTPSNWVFNAVLPTSPAYTYTSDAQRALYPGDKIVYTLGFTMQNNSYSAYTVNNPSYGYQYQYGNQNGVYTYPANCAYTNNYTYNGQYTYPGAAFGCATNNTGYNANYNYGYSNGTMTVQVDPYNYVYESSENNNAVNISL